MPISHHLPGAPCWAELVTPDLRSSRDFYTGLLDWASEPTEPGHYGYSTFTLGGGPITGAAAFPDAPSAARWHTYFGSVDLDATVAAVESAGGTVLSRPRPVTTLGRTAFFASPDGIEFGAWQPGTRTGHARSLEAGAPTGFGLGLPDPGKTLAFFVRVFGWTVTPVTSPGDVGLVARHATSPFGEMRTTDAGSSPPERWIPEFGVTDSARTCARAQQLGGSVLIAGGAGQHWPRTAVLADPHGAVFRVSQLPAESAQQE